MSRDIKYIGMDVHKEATVIAVLNGSGKLVMESIVETKASSILQFIHGLRGELHVTWEEGTWASWLYDLLQPQAAQVLVRSAAQCLIKGRQQERQDRCTQALTSQFLRESEETGASLHATITAHMAPRYYLVCSDKTLAIWGPVLPQAFRGLQKENPQFKLINSYSKLAEARAEKQKRQNSN